MDRGEIEKAASPWQSAVDSIPQLVCLLDRQGHVLGVNRTLERWSLGAPDTAKGRDLHDVLHRDCRDPCCYLRHFWTSATADMAQGQRGRCKVWDPVLDRFLTIVTSAAVPGRDGTGLDGLFAVTSIDDISPASNSAQRQRRDAEEAGERLASEMERRLRSEEVQMRLITIIELTPTLVATSDADGVMLYLNAAGRVLIGLEADHDLSHMTLAGCHAPRAREHFTREALTAAASSGLWHGESVLLAGDGREITVSQVIIAHRDADGNLEGFSIAARDLTEWLQAEELLRKSEAEIHLATQESERQRIAGDLHDGLGQTLSLLKLSIENAARRLSEGSPDDAAEALGRLVPMAKDAMAEVRRIAMDLRPSTLDDLGIVPTLSWFFREFEASCPEIRVDRQVEVQESDVPVPLKLAIYRILQEAISNAAKHAQADRIRVRLWRDADDLQLSIEDNGKGFDVEAMASLDRLPRGLGLKSMRERAELSGGVYDIESAPGHGTRIAITWLDAILMEGDASVEDSPDESSPLGSTGALATSPAGT